MRHRPPPDPLDAHDHALVRIGARDEGVLLEPVALGQLALLRGEQRQDRLERVDAEMTPGGIRSRLDSVSSK